MFSFKRSAKLALTALALTTAVALTPAAAQADPTSLPFKDNFDSPTLGTTWRLEHGPTPPASYVGGGVATGANVAFTGNQALHLTVANAPGSWAGWGRTVYTPTPNPGPTCNARIWVRNDTAAAVHFNVEIIDPATYTYIALQQTGLPYLANWTQQSIYWPMQNQPANAIIVRVSLLNYVDTAHIHLDDLTVNCS